MSVPTLSKSILTDRNSVYTEQDIIEIFVSPEEVPLLNASQGSYLKFLLKVKDEGADTNCLAQPDPMGGGSSVISTISIYDGANSQLLEQLEDVGTWTSMYYHYTKTQGLENMRTLMEGMSPVVGRSLNSQYFTHDPIEGTTYKEVECVVPLYMSGLLGQGAKLLPVVALSGIRIRISLEKKDKALRALTQVGYSSTGSTYTGIRQVSGLSVAGSQDPQTFANAVAIPINPALTSIDVNTAGTDVAPGAGTDTIQALGDFSNIAWMVGQDLWVDEAGTPLNLGLITAISSVGGRCRYTFGATATTAIIAVGAKVWVDANSLRAGFTMSNVEFVCSVVQASGATMNGLMKQVSSGGGVRIDYPSYNLYRQNLQAGIPRSELLIPANEQRACSLVAEPMRSVNRIYEDTLRPVGDALQSYIFNIANRLTPNRRVSTQKVANELAVQRLSWDAIHLHETEKAISRLDVRPRNLCENARCFCVSRQLAKDGHSFDANTNEIRLNLEYGSAPGENVINKLMNTWLYHIRTCIITPNSVAVEF
tara:strand:+ start:1311 stop:2921 length:1611 start_codon:yes stop_codon:yes gene_type:complete